MSGNNRKNKTLPILSIHTNKKEAPTMLQKLAQRLPWTTLRTTPASTVKAGGPASADTGPFSALTGVSGGWNPSEYGDYYAASTPVYAAIRLRADALSRPPAVVYRRVSSETGDHRLPVGPQHPAQQLLDRVNRWYTSADLWRATEIYLNLWGSA